MHWYRFQLKVLKSPVLSIMPTIQVLVEYSMSVSQGGIPMSGGGDEY